MTSHTQTQNNICHCLPRGEISSIKPSTRVFKMLKLWKQNTQNRKRLASLNERLLKDVGMTRADAEQEIAKPFWRN